MSEAGIPNIRIADYMAGCVKNESVPEQAEIRRTEDNSTSAQNILTEAQNDRQCTQTKNLTESVLAGSILTCLCPIRVNGVIYYWNKRWNRYSLLNRQIVEETLYYIFPDIADKRSAAFSDRIVKLVFNQAEVTNNMEGDQWHIILGNGVYDCYHGVFYHGFQHISKSTVYHNTIPIYSLNACYIDNNVTSANEYRCKESNAQACSCEKFDRFLEDVSGGDVELQKRIWEAIGYLLVPDHRGKACILLQGVPNSGKTVLGELINSCFYEENVAATDIIELKTNSDRKNLLGKTLLINTELSDSVLKRKSINIIKQLTGNDLLEANSPIRSGKKINFKNQAKILLATNAPVDLTAREKAIRSRIVTIPFAYEVEPANRDFFLLESLKAEKNAIVTKALHAYHRLVRNNYVFSGDYPLNGVLDEQNYEDADIESFLTDECLKSEKDITLTKDLYARFCEKYSEKYPIHLFSKLLMAECGRRGYAVKRAQPHFEENGAKKTSRGIKGIVLVNRDSITK